MDNLNLPFITPVIVLNSEDYYQNNNINNTIIDNKKYFNKYNRSELIIFNNYCTQKKLLANFHCTRIKKNKNIYITSRFVNKQIKLKNDKVINKICTILYIGKNYYYGIHKNLNDSKLLAVKNALKHNSKLKKYAEKYILTN